MQGRAGQGRAGQGKGRQGRAAQSRAGQGRARDGRAGQGRAGQSRAGQGKEQGRAGGKERGLARTPNNNAFRELELSSHGRFSVGPLPPFPPYNAGFLQHFPRVLWPPSMATARSPHSGSLIIILYSPKCPARSPRFSPRVRASPRYFVFTKYVFVRSPRKSAAVARA